MSVAEAIAIVMFIVQFIKKALPGLKIEKIAAVILVTVASIAVTIYRFISENLPFDIFQFILFAIQVFVGANAGYNLIKVARPKIA